MDLLKRVLVIDDSRLVCEYCRQLLAPCPVEGEPDGPSGLQKALAWQPQVILIDYLMPGWDGIETLQRLLEAGLGQSSLLVMISAQSEECAGRLKRLKLFKALDRPPIVMEKPLDKQLVEYLSQYYRLPPSQFVASSRDSVPPKQQTVAGKALYPNPSLPPRMQQSLDSRQMLQLLLHHVQSLEQMVQHQQTLIEKILELKASAD